MAAWRTTNAQVGQMLNPGNSNGFPQQVQTCKDLLDAILTKANYWGNTDPDPSADQKSPAAVLGWMQNTLAWLLTETAENTASGVQCLHDAREEIDHGGGGNVGFKVDVALGGKKKGKKPAKKQGKKPAPKGGKP